MGFDLSKYENQARLSLVMGVFGTVCALASAVIVLTAFKSDMFSVVYDPAGKRFLAILASLFFAVVCGSVGFFAGLNSAGQKRNKQSQLSWAGFFVNALVLTIALSVFVFFWLTRLPMKPQ